MAPAAPRATPAVAPLAQLRATLDALIERPDPGLDEALNAAAACFARHGVAHTSVPDIAREMGVSKATVYRQMGSVDDVVRLLLARETHRLVDTLEGAVGDAQGPEAVLRLVTAGLAYASSHPLAGKVLRDELDLAAELLPFVPEFLIAANAALGPVIGGYLAGYDVASAPEVLADLVNRLALATLIAPPADLATHVRTAIGPHIGAS